MAEHDRTWNEEMQRWDHWNCQACIDLYWKPFVERRQGEGARERAPGRTLDFGPPV